jgi:Fungal hydrophobin
MKFIIAVKAVLAVVVVAAPAQLGQRQNATYIACSGTYNGAQCCATDVLSLADLNCANRMLRAARKIS